jgi:pilus assembly protein Flp/PilA
VGEAKRHVGLSDATGRRPAGGLAARLSLTTFWCDDAGATAIEYGLIVGLIFIVIVTSATTFGSLTTGLIQRISNTIAATVG